MRHLRTAAIALIGFLFTLPALAQYGTGRVLDVPAVDAGAITIDGNADEEAWANATVISMERGEFNWDGGWNNEYGAEPDIGYTTRLLHADGRLFVHILVEDYQEFFWNNFGGDAAIVGIDLLHQAGVTDVMVDDNWSGFSMNSLDEGPLTFYANGPQGVTINWGGGDDPVDPEAAGFVDAEVVVDETNFTWSVEMAILSDQITSGRQIGFNVGGVAGHPDPAFEYEAGARDYGWFSWETCDPANVPEGVWCGPGGTILQNTFGYGTLNLVEQPYGVGKGLEVPLVDAGAIIIDGNADEEAWANATVISMERGEFNWDGGWNNEYGAEPDIGYTTRLLHADGRLFVHILVEDYQEFFWNNFGGDAAIVGIDLLHKAGVTDVMVDDNWSGFSMNSLEEGPLTFYANGPQGVTINWGGGDDPVDPEAAGFVDAEVVVDETNFTWSVEMAILSDQITPGRQIGFNVGGVAGHPDPAFEYEEGARDYGWFSWATCDPANVPEGVWCGPGGTILQNTFGYGTLFLATTGTTAIEPLPGRELPSQFALEQNYPNPFNPSTSIEYALAHSGHVSLAVYNTLGQLVQTLVDEQMSNGHYRVTWQGDDLPSGVYMYQLRVDGSSVAARTMLLIK